MFLKYTKLNGLFWFTLDLKIVFLKPADYLNLIIISVTKNGMLTWIQIFSIMYKIMQYPLCKPPFH